MDVHVDHCYTTIVAAVVDRMTAAIPRVVVVVVAAAAAAAAAAAVVVAADVAVAAVFYTDLLPVRPSSGQVILDHVQRMLNLFVLVDVISMTVVEVLVMV